ncbi:MAG: GIY-YIG nuclease family protein [Symploca sp. SIO2G7]|nr:GIY-YIG nuclease family protein [Symploca sp. SIO2G7]
MVFDDSHYRNKPGFIYLIHAQETDRYKIGLTTRSVEARFAELNSSQSPYPLELIDWFETPNVTEDEAYFHEKYSAHRVHGEWFVFDKKTLKEVRREYQDDVGFSLPQLPRISLPTLSRLPTINRNNIAVFYGRSWCFMADCSDVRILTKNHTQQQYSFTTTEVIIDYGS